MRRIDIDDDVYTWLETRVRGFETPNDVLRREVLGAGPNVATLQSIPTSRRGALYPLIEAGLVKAGDHLVCHRSRSGDTFRGTVDDAGYIQTAHGEFAKPSPALKAFVGSEIDGWASWLHEESGSRLRDLRAQAGGRGRGAA